MADDKFTRTTPVLQPRDIEVLQMAANGMTHAAIAARLDPPSNPHAVSVRLSRVTEKLGLATVAGAVAAAMREKLIR